MSETVSYSATGQDQPKPTRKERDEAYSTEGGRKAEEQTMPAELKAVGKQFKAALKSTHYEEQLQAPIGLELETCGDKEADNCGKSH